LNALRLNQNIKPDLAVKQLEVCEAGKDRLDVDHGRAVDGFHWADAQAILDDFAHGDAMKADGIWSVGRARGKYARKRTVRV
jgi:hypothetical protein